MARRRLRLRKLRKEKTFKEKPIDIGPIRIHHRFFSLIKLAIGIFLLPFVYSVSASFIRELAGVDRAVITPFINGAAACLLIYLFIWEPHKIYEKGQQLVEFIFQFVSPLMKVASYIVPVYSLILLIIFWVSNIVFKARFVNIFMFLISFSFCFHLLLTARVLRNKERDILKANYLFGFSFVYIINLIILGLFLNFIFVDFSFVELVNQTYFGAGKIFFYFLNQLFGVR